jgi:hypothetical protein
MRVRTIKASSPFCKTIKGIGIGSTKLQVIGAYDGYYMDIGPEYEADGSVKSKRLSHIIIRKDREGNTILFNLVDKKVVSFEIFPYYDDEE